MQPKNKEQSRETHQLSNQESSDEKQTRALDKRPTAGSCDEDKGLTNGANLQVNCGGELSEVILGCFLKAFDLEYPLKRGKKNNG